MDDDRSEQELTSGLGRSRALESVPAAGMDPSADPLKGADPIPGSGGERWRSVRSAVQNFWSGLAEPKPVLVTGLAMAVAVAVALTLYSAGTPGPSSPPGPAAVSADGRGESAETEGGSDPFAASSPPIVPGESETAGRQEVVDGAAGDEVAYVAASLLICRDAPVPQARRVRNLLRGREVRVLGYDGAWASLAYGGGRCWAQAQYLSPVPPL